MHRETGQGKPRLCRVAGEVLRPGWPWGSSLAFWAAAPHPACTEQLWKPQRFCSCPHSGVPLLPSPSSSSSSVSELAGRTPSKGAVEISCWFGQRSLRCRPSAGGGSPERQSCGARGYLQRPSRPPLLRVVFPLFPQTPWRWPCEGRN